MGLLIHLRAFQGKPEKGTTPPALLEVAKGRSRAPFSRKRDPFETNVLVEVTAALPAGCCQGGELGEQDGSSLDPGFFRGPLKSCGHQVRR